MWLFRGAQSAVYYYLSCIPCANAVDFHKRKKEAHQARKEQEKNNNALVTDQPRPFLQPTPFSTNPGWAEDIALGPGPPARKNRVDKFVRSVEDLQPPIVGNPRNHAEVQWMVQPPPSAKVMAGKEEEHFEPVSKPSGRNHIPAQAYAQFEYPRKYVEDLMLRPPPGARGVSPSKKEKSPESNTKALRCQSQLDFPCDYAEDISVVLTESGNDHTATRQSPRFSEMPNPNLRSKKTPKNVIVPSDIHLFYASSDCDLSSTNNKHVLSSSSSDHDLPSVQGALSSTGRNNVSTSVGRDLSTSGCELFLSKRNLSSYGYDLDVPYSECEMAFSDDEIEFESSRPQTPDVKVSPMPNPFLRSRKIPKHVSVPDNIHLFYSSSDFDLPSALELDLPRASDDLSSLYRYARNASIGSLESVAVI